MARIRIVTDSASDLPKEFAKRLDIDVVSLTIRFGDEEFTDGVDLTPEVFWAKCKRFQDLARNVRSLTGRLSSGLRTSETRRL